MSRFDWDGDGPEYNNAGDLWWANIERALSGRRGQSALADLEEALLALPEPVLIEGHLAEAGQVCAVGALIAHKRVLKGDKLADVLAELEGNASCTCGHGRESHEHGTGSCSAQRSYSDNSCWCEGWDRETDEDEYGSGYVTANAGVSVGLTYALAWRLAYLNDEDCAGLAPPERYQRVLAWVRKAQGKPEEVAA